MPNRPKKRARKTPNGNGNAHASSSQAGPSKTVSRAPIKPRLFAPFRALGLVCDHVPFAMFVHLPKGALATPNVQIVSSVGRSWVMWDAARMTLNFVGPDAGAPISSLLVTGTEVYAAAGGRVIKYIRGKEQGSYRTPDSAAISTILIFGDHLLGLKEDGTGMLIWDLASRKVENEITFHPSFSATTLLHPSTYLNKVIVGSSKGELQLWNIRTCQMIHSFPFPLPGVTTSVTSIVQSPAVDVLGVGYSDGTIHVLDIRLGELIMEMKNESGAVTSMAFRMDGPAVMATGATNGSIALWDLAKGGRIQHVQRQAHEQGVSGLQWVAGQPLLISSSGDNSIKQWLFDSPEAVPRLLKLRGGHHAPPTFIRYYGEDGKQILTAGRDRALRYTSVVRDSRSHELSQGSFFKKALSLDVSAASLKYPPITAMSSASIRSKDWEDVLTAHADDPAARTWRVQEKRAGPHTFSFEDGSAVQSVCVTACGNFGVAGSSSGEIRMWNMQSGKERKRFALNGEVLGNSKPGIIVKSKPAKKRVEKDKVKSMLAVTGLATDTLNTTVVASTLEGKLYFFDFHTTALVQTLELPSSVTSMTAHRDNGLLSLICDDLVVRLVDIETRRVVRELRGFKGRILDIAFSPDSRWLIATSLDSVVRTFDIPTGTLVDVFRTASIATSLTFSPTGDFLATSHVDSVGVHLWANRAQFSDIALRHINEEDEVPEVAIPGLLGDEETTLIEGLEPVGEPEKKDIYTTPDQLAEGLLTLSLMPRTRWQTLLNLETIRQRNKPKEPPKAPEQAPFFLPTIQGIETKFDLSGTNGDASIDDNQSSRPKLAPLGSVGDLMETDFTRRLSKEDENGDYNSFFEYMKSLSPSTVDLEIRSLLALPHLNLFLHALTRRLRSHRDFEAVQAYMSVFLGVHGDVLVDNEELTEGLVELKRAQAEEGKRVGELVRYALGTLSFLRTAGL